MQHFHHLIVRPGVANRKIHNGIVKYPVAKGALQVIAAHFQNIFCLSLRVNGHIQNPAQSRGIVQKSPHVLNISAGVGGGGALSGRVLQKLHQLLHLVPGPLPHIHQEHGTAVTAFNQASVGIDHRHPVICNIAVGQHLDGVLRLHPVQISSYPIQQFFLAVPEGIAAVFYRIVVGDGADVKQIRIGSWNFAGNIKPAQRLAGLIGLKGLVGAYITKCIGRHPAQPIASDEIVRGGVQKSFARRFHLQNPVVLFQPVTNRVQGLFGKRILKLLLLHIVPQVGADLHQAVRHLLGDFRNHIVGNRRTLRSPR